MGGEGGGGVVVEGKEGRYGSATWAVGGRDSERGERGGRGWGVGARRRAMVTVFASVQQTTHARESSISCSRICGKRVKRLKVGGARRSEETATRTGGGGGGEESYRGGRGSGGGVGRREVRRRRRSRGDKVKERWAKKTRQDQLNIHLKSSAES
eukprot:765900-Hanusia_phi.AAC.2